MADAIVIQAVADALNLTIHIIEFNPGFASVTKSVQLAQKLIPLLQLLDILMKYTMFQLFHSMNRQWLSM